MLKSKRGPNGEISITVSLSSIPITIPNEVIEENITLLRDELPEIIVELFMDRLLMELNKDLVPELLDRVRRHIAGRPQLIYEYETNRI